MHSTSDFSTMMSELSNFKKKNLLFPALSHEQEYPRLLLGEATVTSWQMSICVLSDKLCIASQLGVCGWSRKNKSLPMNLNADEHAALVTVT